MGWVVFDVDGDGLSGEDWERGWGEMEKEEEFQRSRLGYTECLLGMLAAKCDAGSLDAMASKYLGEPNEILISRLEKSLADSCFGDSGALMGEDDANEVRHDPLF